MPATTAKLRLEPRHWHILHQLAKADGPIYDQVCADVCTKFTDTTSRAKYWKSRLASLAAVRDLMWHGYVTTEPDETCWLTPTGWKTLR